MFPAGGGTNLPTSGQLQEAAIALATTAGKYTAVSEELVAVAASALAAGQDLTTRWRGKAPASFLTSLDKLAGDVSNIADALATSGNAMMTLADAIGSQSGSIMTANQLTAQAPAHPSSGQAQQLSNALVAANAAMGAITAAANAAAGQLDQVTGVGTCSTGKNKQQWYQDRFAAIALELKELDQKLGGPQASGNGGKGKPPDKGPPYFGDEPSGKRWHNDRGKPNWQLRVFRAFKDAFIASAVNVWYNDGKNYAVAYGESKWDIPGAMLTHPLYDISSSFSQNATGTIISVVIGGLAGGFGANIPGEISIPWTSRTISVGEELSKHGGAAGTLGGSVINGLIRPLPHPIQKITDLPGDRVMVRVFQNGRYQVQVWSDKYALSQVNKSGQPFGNLPPGVNLSPTPTPTPSAPVPSPAAPHAPPG